MDDKIVQALMGLLRYEIYQKPLSEKMMELLRSIDTQQLYDLALKHDVAHLVAHALEENQLLVSDDPVAELFESQRMLAFFRYKQLIYEFDRVCDALEESEIPFVPLKGSVIRKFYPEEWMRVSCDIDILVESENTGRAELILRDRLQYRKSGQSAHDISLYSQNDVHVELHFSLIESKRMSQAMAVLNRVWRDAHSAHGCVYQKEMSPEMIYFYHIAHMAKHVQTGGCGIRFFLDTKILCDRLKMDSVRKEELLKEGGLLTFESYARRLSEVWFDDGQMDKGLFTFHQFIIDGGSYGDMSNHVAGNSELREKNIFQYFLSRLFPPKDIVFIGYPITKKHPWLLPLFYVIRPFHRFFTVSKQRLFREMQLQNDLSEEKKTAIDDLFFMLEIDSETK